MILSLGIDPGLSGALALLDADAKLLALVDMPTLVVSKSRREINAAHVAELLRIWTSGYGPLRVTLERAFVMPGQGASSGLKTGIGFGTLLGVLAAMQIAHHVVAPQTWQKSVLGKVDRGAAKDRARAFAQAAYPEADLGRRKSQDRADAVCLAVYGFERWRGK